MLSLESQTLSFTTRSQAGPECGPGPGHPPVWVVILSRPRQHTFVIICQTTANMKEYQSGEVKGLLETLSVPHNPPNRYKEEFSF